MRKVGRELWFWDAGRGALGSLNSRRVNGVKPSWIGLLLVTWREVIILECENARRLWRSRGSGRIEDGCVERIETLLVSPRYFRSSLYFSVSSQSFIHPSNIELRSNLHFKMADILTQLQTCLDQVHKPSSPAPSTSQKNFTSLTK